MNVVAIPDENLQLNGEFLDYLVEILPSMAAFCPEKYGLPPF
jgi:hypothetical protein